LALLAPATAFAALGFSAPAALNTNADTDSGTDWYPQVTTDGAGNWVAVWFSEDTLGGTIGSDYDILVSRSMDNGATWTTPAALNTNAATDSGPDYEPQVTTNGVGNWVAVWHSDNTLSETIGSDYDILVSRSTDNGVAWTAPAPLNTNAATDSGDDYSPQVTTDGVGNWVAVWSSYDTLGETIGSDQDILVSRSTDNGVAWTAPAPLNTNATTDSGHDGTPRVTTDGAGNWVTVWNSIDTLGGTIGEDWDILVSRSTDNGATWTAPATLNNNAATDSVHDGSPELTTDGAGNWVTVWESIDTLGGTIGSDDDILVSRSTDNGATWTATTALNTNAVTDLENDLSPQVTTDGWGNWVAVWFSDETLGGTIGEDWDILVSRSTDNGTTWTDPAALNINADTDSGADWYPQVTTDGAGNWVAVWFSIDTLGGTIGSDWDILVSTTTTATLPVELSAFAIE
jgi:Neuraminidase (sialidase)